MTQAPTTAPTAAPTAASSVSQTSDNNTSLLTSTPMTSPTANDLTTHFNGTNGTALPSVNPTSGPAVPGGVIALFVGLMIVGVAVFALIIYLRKTGRLYNMIPFKRLGRERRSSTSSSIRRPLDLEPDPSEHGDGEHAQMDDLPAPREGTMFTIDDAETDPVDLDTQSRGTNDEYFYDEVYGKSGFEDEVTNASMRHLYLSSDQQDDADLFDVDTIINSITGTKSTTAKT